MGRLGGDEFAIAFPKISGEKANDIIQRVQQQLEDLALSLQKPYPMGYSVGVVHVGSGEEIYAEEILNEADVAMYHQKKLRLELLKSTSVGFGARIKTMICDSVE